MKNIIIPYCVPDQNGWWTALNAINQSPYPTQIRVTTQRNSNGGVGRVMDKSIPPYTGAAFSPAELNLFLNDPTGACSLHIICDDYTFLAPGMGNSSGGGYMLPSYDIGGRLCDYLRGDVLSSSGDAIFSHDIVDSSYFVFGGDCEYIRQSHFAIIELLAMYMYHKFPSRTDRLLSVGDACPVYGACPSHPSGHADKMTVDFNYFTLGPNNTTQYRPGVSGDWCYPITNIWTVRPTVLNEAVFDWERNFIAMRFLYRLFPSVNLRTNDVIKSYMYAKVVAKYGQSEGNLFQQKVQFDAGSTYQHDTHWHVAMGAVINKEVDI